MTGAVGISFASVLCVFFKPCLQKTVCESCCCCVCVCQQPYKWIRRCYWPSHKCVVTNMCEPSCEKSKKCALACYSIYHMLLLFFPLVHLSLSLSCLCLHLNGSPLTRYYIKTWIKKIPASHWSCSLSDCVNSVAHLLCFFLSLTARYASPPGHSGIGSPQKKNTR